MSFTICPCPMFSMASFTAFAPHLAMSFPPGSGSRPAAETGANDNLMTTLKTCFSGRLAACCLLTCLFAAFSSQAKAQTLASGQIVTNTFGSTVILLNTEPAPNRLLPPFTVQHDRDPLGLLDLSAG